MINEANNLNQTAIIDCRGPNPGLFHDAYRAFAVRARLDREHGTHANQLIWEGPIRLTADNNCELNSFIAMDHWLTGVEQDQSRTPLARKLIRDKPSGLTDECWDGNGNKLSSSLCPAGVVNVEGTPRTVAGDAITTDANKCQLKPLRAPIILASRSPTLSGPSSRRRSPQACATTQSRALTSSRRSHG